MLLNNLEVPWAVHCLFMAPVPVKRGIGDCHCACGSLELPRENKAAYTEHTRESCNNLVPLSRAEAGTTA